jgi:hypothetical protein
MQALTEAGYPNVNVHTSGMMPLMLSGVDVIGQAKIAGKTSASWRFSTIIERAKPRKDWCSRPPSSGSANAQQLRAPASGWDH